MHFRILPGVMGLRFCWRFDKKNNMILRSFIAKPKTHLWLVVLGLHCPFSSPWIIDHHHQPSSTIINHHQPSFTSVIPLESHQNPITTMAMFEDRKTHVPSKTRETRLAKTRAARGDWLPNKTDYKWLVVTGTWISFSHIFWKLSYQLIHIHFKGVETNSQTWFKLKIVVPLNHKFLGFSVR